MVKNLPNISNQIQYVPPRPDEIEVSLFGPGIGECIVAHIGYNEWIIVDSCVETSTKEPTPLNYLKKLGVDPCRSVKLFVVTHWHSDHIRGASQIAKECAAATICFSEALMKEEFLTLVSAYSGLEHPVILDRETCGTKEISSIIKTIKARCNQKGPYYPLHYDLASANKRIYKRKQHDIKIEIWALSPSSQAIIDSLTEVARLIPTPSKDEIRKVIPVPTKNHNAIVLLLKCDDIINILLGSDLEETADQLTGWSAVVNSNNRPTGKSKIYKIPHHGSKNAHSHMVWENMLEAQSVGILTTKIGGKAGIPKNSDIKRLKEYTPHLFCTLEPSVKKQKHDRIVEKTIKGILKRRIPLIGDMGQIQIRVKQNSELTIGLKEPAIQL